MKKLTTVAEVKSYCMEHYNDGLDVIIECWDDADIQEAIDNGSIEKELQITQEVITEEREAARYFSGESDVYSVDSTDNEIQEEDEPYSNSYFEEEKDYSPSNPWDAPGMSVRDFI